MTRRDLEPEGATQEFIIFTHAWRLNTADTSRINNHTPLPCLSLQGRIVEKTWPVILRVQVGGGADQVVCN